MAQRMVTYVTHERKTEGELITVEACGRAGGKAHPGEKCFFPKGHKGKHSWGKPEGIWAISGVGEMYLTGGFKYDHLWFALQYIGAGDESEDARDPLRGWAVVGTGATPEELVASVADTLATGEEVPEKNLLAFLAAFKQWLATPKHDFELPSWQFRYCLPDMPEIVVMRMPNFGT